MNYTTNYELTQFESNDIPGWLTNYNTDMGKIDTAIAGVKQTAKSGVDAAGAAQQTANTANASAAEANAAAQAARTTAQSAKESVDNLTIEVNNNSQAIHGMADYPVQIKTDSLKLLAGPTPASLAYKKDVKCRVTFWKSGKIDIVAENTETFTINSSNTTCFAVVIPANYNWTPGYSNLMAIGYIGTGNGYQPRPGLNYSTSYGNVVYSYIVGTQTDTRVNIKFDLSVWQ